MSESRVTLELLQERRPPPLKSATIRRKKIMTHFAIVGPNDERLFAWSLCYDARQV